jgi:hypothetical protein
MRTVLALLVAGALATACYSPPKPRFESQHFTVPSFDQMGLETVAVLFENRSDMEINHERIQNALEGALLTQKRYRVVTRTRMDQILAESSLAVSDLTQDPENLGELLNVDALLFVGIDELRLELGWGGVATGTLVSVHSGETCFTNTIEFAHIEGDRSKVASEMAKRFLEDLPAAGTGT